MLLVEYTLLDNLQVINENTAGGTPKLKLRGRFQKCDEQNNNGRIYPRKILESQVQKIQEKIKDRSLVGALDHPANDAIHLSQASHLITGLSVSKDGDVIGECEILSTPNGKIVESLINDGVKIGISSRGVGSVSEGREGKVVNEDFKLITFDLVSDPSTKGAFPELTESIRENSQRAQEIVSKHRKERVMMTMLESKVNQKLAEGKKKDNDPLRLKLLARQKPAAGHEDLPPKTKSKITNRAAKRKNSPKASKTPKKGSKPQTGQMESVEIFGKTMLEAFKRVCWGDRYDEGEVKKRNKARMRKALAKLGAGTLADEKTFTPAERAGSYETYRKGGGKGQTGNVIGKGRAKLRKKFGQADDVGTIAKRKIAKGTTGVPPGPGDKKSSRTAMKPRSQNSSIEIFGKVIREGAFKRLATARSEAREEAKKKFVKPGAMQGTSFKQSGHDHKKRPGETVDQYNARREEDARQARIRAAKPKRGRKMPK